jgi:hypothetical protein
MTGYEGLNFPAFHAEAAIQRSLGYEVVSPAEINGGADELVACATMTPEQLAAHYQSCMRNDISQLVTCARIVLLRGWENSKGAMLELRIAKVLGFEVVDLDPPTA